MDYTKWRLVPARICEPSKWRLIRLGNPIRRACREGIPAQKATSSVRRGAVPNIGCDQMQDHQVALVVLDPCQVLNVFDALGTPMSTTRQFPRDSDRHRYTAVPTMAPMAAVKPIARAPQNTACRFDNAFPPLRLFTASRTLVSPLSPARPC